jgi:hypothetical protein
MSYLRGPLTREHIRKLGQTEDVKAPVPAAIPPPPPTEARVTTAPPLPLPPGIPQCWLEATRPGPVRGYRPVLIGKVKLHYVKAPANIDLWEEPGFCVPLTEGISPLLWDELERLPEDVVLSENEPYEAPYDALPAAAANPKSYAAWEREAKQVLYEKFSLRLLSCPALKLQSEPGESEADFKARASMAHREARDLAVTTVKGRYESKFATLRERIRRAEEQLERREATHKEKKLSSAVQFGSTLLGALLGRKTVSATNVRRAGTAISSAGRLGKSKEDIQRAEEEFALRNRELEEMELRFKEDLAALEERHGSGPVFEEVCLPARKTDLRLTRFGLGWMPE